MPYEVSIHLKTDTDMSEVTSAEQAIKALGQTSTQVNQKIAQETTRAAEQTNRALQGNAVAANNASISYQKFRPAVALAASQVAGLGPVSNIATGALIALTAGSAGTGLALAGIGVALGFLIPKIQEFQAESEKARQSQIFGLGSVTKQLTQFIVLPVGSCSSSRRGNGGGAG
jgi:uncharacterized protein (UPF0261 family)